MSAVLRTDLDMGSRWDDLNSFVQGTHWTIRRTPHAGKQC